MYDEYAGSRRLGQNSLSHAPYRAYQQLPFVLDHLDSSLTMLSGFTQMTLMDPEP
jgi:hypothetical protein